MTKNTNNELVEVSNTGYMDKFIKLIAQENLTVVRSANYKTASIDLTNRVIKIPAFSTKNESVAVLMSAHEVSHALNTPPRWYHCSSAGFYSKQLLQCINIVEDIRIERLIKNKYIGLRNVFNVGYKALLDQSFFGDLDRNLCFADLVNIWAKVGNLSPVRITNSRDYAAYKYIASAKTYEDVIPRARFLLEYNKTNTNFNGGMEFNPDFDEDSKDGDGEPFDTDSLSDDDKKKLEDALKESRTHKPGNQVGDGPPITTEVDDKAQEPLKDNSRREKMVKPTSRVIRTPSLPGVMTRKKK